MPMTCAPKDRLIYLFCGSDGTVIGRWNDALGWIAEYKDVDGRCYVAVVHPFGWMR